MIKLNKKLKYPKKNLKHAALDGPTRLTLIRKAQACESVSLGASLGFEFFFFSLFTLIFIIKKIEQITGHLLKKIKNKK